MRKYEKPLVLMADDDEDDCMLARDAFEESQAPGDFCCVQDATELLNYLLGSGKYGERARAPLPALIILDLNMPGKDGRQALREIKSIPALQNIPVVILTTTREDKDIAFSREMGANSIITKPAEFEKWVEMMKSLAQSWLVR